MIKRPEPIKYCKYAGETHPKHNQGDGLGMPGICGFCNGSADFFLEDGNWVAKKHRAGIKKRR